MNSLPKTPKELIRFKGKDRLIYPGLIAFFKATGLWKYPAKASGDLETMSLLDKVYWIYKTTDPVRKAARRSGLESHFAKSKQHQWKLPEGFVREKQLVLSAVGDLINHPYLIRSKESLYRLAHETIFGVDVAMANLECSVIENVNAKFEFTTKSGPPLYYPQDQFDVIKASRGRNYDFMATACNHSLDFGMQGVHSTIKALSESGISYHGLNTREDEHHQARLLEKNGIKIGLVAYTFGLNGYMPPKEQPFVVNRLNLNAAKSEIDFAQFKKQLDYCAEKNVDFKIAHLHWGMEHELYPRPEQVEVAHHLAEMGFDAIIGHHPHVIQPVEYYKTKRDSARVVPIYYSLGNLVNAFSADYLCSSLLAKLKLAKGTLNGKVTTLVEHAEGIELFQRINPDQTITIEPRGKLY